MDFNDFVKKREEERAIEKKKERRRNKRIIQTSIILIPVLLILNILVIRYSLPIIADTQIISAENEIIRAEISVFVAGGTPNNSTGIPALRDRLKNAKPSLERANNTANPITFGQNILEAWQTADQIKSDAKAIQDKYNSYWRKYGGSS